MMSLNTRNWGIPGGGVAIKAAARKRFSVATVFDGFVLERWL